MVSKPFNYKRVDTYKKQESVQDVARITKS